MRYSPHMEMNVYTACELIPALDTCKLLKMDIMVNSITLMSCYSRVSGELCVKSRS